MIAKQYPIALPAAYDMGIIRQRVADKGSAYDTRPGLLFKAFLISERGQGAPLNQYAPFYVWQDSEPMWDFVAGDGFGGIVDSFGRPSILTWLPWAAVARSELRRGEVHAAIREDMPIALGASLPALRRTHIEESKTAIVGDSGAALRVVAVNIERWMLVRFTLRYDDNRAEAPDAQHYEVLHLSAPGYP